MCSFGVIYYYDSVYVVFVEYYVFCVKKLLYTRAVQEDTELFFFKFIAVLTT